MKVRQKFKSLMLCLVMLMTMLVPTVVHAEGEEQLLQVDDGYFINDEVTDVIWCIPGKYEASNNYKFISEYEGMYYYNYDVETL